MRELNHHVPPAVAVLCGKDTRYCTNRRRGGLLGAGWFKICTMTFTDKAVPGGGTTCTLSPVLVMAFEFARAQYS